METARSMLNSSAGRRPGTSSGLNRVRGHGSDDIAFMVNKLNQVLNLKLTLVSFDELTHNQELLPLFQQLLIYLSPEQRVDLSKESAEDTVRRVTHFLANILNMRYVKQIPPQEFSQGLLHGDRKILYPIFFQILERVEDYKTKVYLSKYLVEVKIPNELFSFDDVAEVYNQYKQLLDQFKQVHQVVHDLRGKVSSPDQLKNEIIAQEKEKDQLVIKIDDLKKKIKDMTTQPAKIIEMTRELRKEVETEEKLAMSERDQKAKLSAAQELLSEAILKLEEVQRNVGEGDILSRVTQLEEQVQQYQQMSQHQLPSTIEQLKVQSDILRKVKNLSSVSDLFNTIENDIRRLKEEISILQDKNNEKDQTEVEGDDRMMSFSKMMIAKKKDLQKKLDHYIKESKKLDDKKAELEEELKTYEGKKVPTKEEFEKYKIDIMNTANKCREMKQELALIKNETAILKRTEDILKSRDTNIEDLLQDLEKKHGVSGFRDVQKNLEHVSMAKGNIDELKGQTLEQISKVVQEINDQINSKKALYKPKVAKLREARQEMQNLEHEYSEKRAVYENTRIEYESERNKNLDEMAQLQADIERAESIYHQINCTYLINKNQKKRVDDEREFREGKKQLNVHFKDYKSMFTAELTKLEDDSKELRDKQREIKENYEPALKQISWMNNMNRILECKLQLKDQQALLSASNTNTSTFGNNTGSVGVPSVPPMVRPFTGLRQSVPSLQQPSMMGVDRLVIDSH